MVKNKSNKVWRPASLALVLLTMSAQVGCLGGSSATMGFEEYDEAIEAELPLQADAEAQELDQNQDPVLEALAAAGDWELAFSQAPLTLEAPPPQFDALSDTELAALQQQAENDPSWYAKDGERYEALYVTGEGVIYGRRGPAPEAPNPNEEKGDFASEGFSERSHQGLPDGPSDRFAIEGAGPVNVEIGTDSSNDQRVRVLSTTTLQSYPYRVVGAMSGDGSTNSGSCSGAKIAPRAVLTASHCVLTPAGLLVSNGFFNPGQTNTATPNGSFGWNGVFLRDWRLNRKWDYAIIFLDDSAAMVGLGWMAAAWWTSAAGYNGTHGSNIGFPCGPNGPANCGTIGVQTCAASPRADKRCDGWMYGSGAPLDNASFMSGDLLKFYNDLSKGHSGSPLWTTLSDGTRAILAVATHSDGIGTNVMGPRFRQGMWDDVCSWIGQKPSAFGTHPCQ